MTGGSIIAAENQIEIVRGATKVFELEVTDAHSEAVDLTGARVVLSVKCSLEDASPLIQKDSEKGATQVDITTPKEGLAEIKFVPSDTQTTDIGEYIFDVWVVLASGAQNPVVQPSPFIIKAGVTVLV